MQAGQRAEVQAGQKAFQAGQKAEVQAGQRSAVQAGQRAFQAEGKNTQLVMNAVTRNYVSIMFFAIHYIYD